MNTPERFAELVQTFFCDYLIKQRDLSPLTVSAYRDTFRLLLSFLQRACGKRPDQLMLSDLTAAQLLAFLQYLEEERGNCVRSRNLRLAALRTFFRYVGACEGPEMIAQTQRIMAIPLNASPVLCWAFFRRVKCRPSWKSWTTPGAGAGIICSFFFSIIPAPACPKLFWFECKTSGERTTVPCNCWVKAEGNERCLSGRKPRNTSVPG
jgi:Phage integrase, N-terminal SAM-like domain